MTIEDFITKLFCCVDDKLSLHGKNRKHSQAKLKGSLSHSLFARLIPKNRISDKTRVRETSSCCAWH